MLFKFILQNNNLIDMGLGLYDLQAAYKNNKIVIVDNVYLFNILTSVKKVKNN